MTTDDPLPPRRVAVVVICDVPAATRADAASLAEHVVFRALRAAPNVVATHPATRRPTLRHLVGDHLDDPRDLTVQAVAELTRALGEYRLVTAVPLGDPEPPPTLDD